jgi:cytochrome P450 family 110
MTQALRGTKVRALTSMRVLKDPFYWMERWRDKFGDPFLLQTLNGPVVMTGRPEAIKEIFLAKADLHKPFAVENARSYIGENSLLLQRGEAHKRHRKLLLPPFHGKRMKAYSQQMARITRQKLNAVPHGEQFTMLDFGLSLTLDVILSAVFGFTDDAERDSFARVVTAYMETLHPSFMFAAALQRPMWPPWRRFCEARERYEAIMVEKINELRPIAHEREDILSMMLVAEFDDGSKMSERELIEQLNTLLIAGHETTAITMAWAVYWLFRNPTALTRTREEIEALGPKPDPEAYTKLPYLDAVIKETLRIRPIVTEVLRTLTGPFELMGQPIEAGTTVAPSVSLVHADPKIYPEPDAFRPERFLERKFSPYEYIPFGGGNRRCIGAAFAEFELRIALGILLTEADLDLVDDRVLQPTRRSLTMAPDGGVKMRMRSLREVKPPKTKKDPETS